jgi:hypothetical protein
MAIIGFFLCIVAFTTFICIASGDLNLSNISASIIIGLLVSLGVTLIIVDFSADKKTTTETIISNDFREYGLELDEGVWIIEKTRIEPENLWFVTGVKTKYKAIRKLDINEEKVTEEVKTK